LVGTGPASDEADRRRSTIRRRQVDQGADAVSVDGARRIEILETAARLFASSGLRTSLKEIADACGILPGSLYHHFESKDAIIVELIERYRADLDAIADQTLDELREPGAEPVEPRIVALGTAIAACAVRHRAAVLLTFYDPPSGSSEQLLRAARRTPMAIEKAMLETLRLGREGRYIRSGIDLETLAERLSQTMLYISLGVFHDAHDVDRLATIRCHILLQGVAVQPPGDAELDRSNAFRAAQEIIDSWDKADDADDERLTKLRAVARAEFGRKGYEATTVRDIGAAAGIATGTVYRLIGSKDALLASIMRSFEAKVRSAWRGVLESESTAVEKLDALMWVDINVVDRFSDEYNIRLAWLRESPPRTLNLGQTFTARLRDLKSLLAQGTRSGAVHVQAPSADVRAWSLFDLMWMHETIVHKVGARSALALARDTVLRGAARSS
jgi:AcrR family transcriptional regulator